MLLFIQFEGPFKSVSGSVKGGCGWSKASLELIRIRTIWLFLYIGGSMSWASFKQEPYYFGAHTRGPDFWQLPKGSLLGSPYNKDHNVLGSILGPPIVETLMWHTSISFSAWCLAHSHEEFIYHYLKNMWGIWYKIYVRKMGPRKGSPIHGNCHVGNYWGLAVQACAPACFMLGLNCSASGNWADVQQLGLRYHNRDTSQILRIHTK